MVVVVVIGEGGVIGERVLRERARGRLLPIVHTHPHAVAGRVLDLVAQRLLVALAAVAPAAPGHGCEGGGL